MRYTCLCLAAAALLSLTASLHATTLLSESFDELTPRLGVTSAGAFSTINGTNVDIVGPSNGYGYLCASPAGGNCIDMDGSGGHPQGQLRSNVQFGIGTYLLSFDLIGDERGQTSATMVTFGDYDYLFSLSSGDTIDGIVSNQLVTLAAPGYLLFTSEDPAGDEMGNVLDNVAISSVASGPTGPTSSATPEPSSFLLLGTGVLGIAGRLRRRFA